MSNKPVVKSNPADKSLIKQLQLDLEDMTHKHDKLKSEHYQLELEFTALKQKHKRTADELEQRKILGA